MALTKTHNRMIAGSAANVADFGAVGDNATDDSSAIQAALDSGSGIVLMDEKFYAIGSTLNIPDGVALVGQGKAKTRLKLLSNITAVSMTNVNDASLEGVLIIAHSTQTSGVITLNATTQTIARCRIRNIQCSGSNTDFPFIYLTTANGAYGNWAHLIDDVSVSGCGTIFKDYIRRFNS